MALQIDLPDTVIGVPVTGAYARIQTMTFGQGADGTDILSVEVGIFYSKKARDVLNAAPIQTKYFIVRDFNHNKPQSPKAQVYGWLKGQSSFAQAVDV